MIESENVQKRPLSLRIFFQFKLIEQKTKIYCLLTSKYVKMIRQRIKRTKQLSPQK